MAMNYEPKRTTGDFTMDLADLLKTLAFADKLLESIDKNYRGKVSEGGEEHGELETWKALMQVGDNIGDAISTLASVIAAGPSVLSDPQKK